MRVRARIAPVRPLEVHSCIHPDFQRARCARRRSDVLPGVFLLAFAATAILVAAVHRYALRRRVLDVPTERSSHAAPTPRGGGLGIAVTIAVAVAALASTAAIAVRDAAGLLGGLVLVATIGWLDDHRPIGPGVRAVVQVIAVAWALAMIGVPEALDAGVARVPLGPSAPLVYAIAVVWLINLYNFMDGTDGIAATEGLAVALAAALLFAHAGAPGWAYAAAAIGGACAGFLPWNWAPAKIFMGDVGSYALGFAFGALALIGERDGSVPALVWAVLLAAFAWDATFTLLARIRAGERWYAPHKRHAYQRCVQLGHGHAAVALGVLALNLLVCWPLAWTAWRWPAARPWAVIASALIMLVIWLALQRRHRLRCGAPT